MAGQIFVVSGPSGAGKSTLIRLVMEGVRDLGYSISHTTRAPRENEVDGLHYHFVDRDTFQAMIRKGDLLEWAEVYADLYGTSFSSVRSQVERGMDVIMDVDVQGARNIRQGMKDCVLVFLLPPSLQVLEERLRARATDSEDALRKRMQKALQEICECLRYDYLVFNDDLYEAVEAVRSIVLSERHRTDRQTSKVRETFRIA
ncbi:MAG: guanylate kinase [Deltaproteobacteria bacterium]|nr:guanylate kinase [Deltaproteobacteria bacterium]